MTGSAAELSVAVLGAGSIGLRHLRNLRALGVDRLVCFEPDAARREQAATGVGVDSFAELEAVWEFAPTAVVVAAPTQYHLPLALASAERGLHLFVEKPLAPVLAGLAPLLRCAEERQLVTMVGCNMRFHPGPAKVRQLLGEDAVGKVISARIQCGSYLPRWRPAQDYRGSYSASPQFGGAILDCIHEIDLALWYFGAGRLLAAAVAPAASLDLPTDGLAELLIRHDAGTLSSVHLNFIQRDYRRGCQIIGERGTIDWDFQGRRVTVCGELGETTQSFGEPEGWEINRMYLDEMDHFLRKVSEGQPTMNPLRQGFAALEIAEAARAENWRL